MLWLSMSGTQAEMVAGPSCSCISSVLLPVDKTLLLKVLYPTGDGEVTEDTASECHEQRVRHRW